jgi:hypothetical protein
MGAAAVVGPAILGTAGVASATAGAVMATGVAATYSVGYGLSQYQDYADAKRRTFSIVDGSTQHAVADIKDFEEARDNFAMSVALSPTDYLGTGLYLHTGAAMTYTLGKLLAKPAARLALKNTLIRNGMAAFEADGVIKNLLSSDPKVASAAVKTVINNGGADGWKVNLLRVAASKGLVFEKNPEAAKAVLGAIKDEKTARKAVSILENVNAAKVNEGNREEILNAARAGAEFGVTEPKKLAGVINDWDQGLDGLAKAYEVATSKLAGIDPAKFPTLKDRQFEALSQSLDELMEASPEFKAMAAEERAKAKQQMMGCGGMGVL